MNESRGMPGRMVGVRVRVGDKGMEGSGREGVVGMEMLGGVMFKARIRSDQGVECKG